MFIKKYAQNSNVNKNRVGIPMQELKTIIKIGPEFQSLKGKAQNSNASKRKVVKSNNWKEWIAIEMFQRIGPEYQGKKRIRPE